MVHKLRANGVTERQTFHKWTAAFSELCLDISSSLYNALSYPVHCRKLFEANESEHLVGLRAGRTPICFQ